VDPDQDFIQSKMLDPGSGISESGTETLLETAMKKCIFYSETATVVYMHLAAGKMNT
jgi:hypothetical protein